MNILLFFLLGFYIGIAIPVFGITLFFVVLGGKTEELWIPFVYSVFWLPILIGWICKKK